MIHDSSSELVSATFVRFAKNFLAGTGCDEKKFFRGNAVVIRILQDDIA
jgi:hypothetical protein